MPDPRKSAEQVARELLLSWGISPRLGHLGATTLEQEVAAAMRAYRNEGLEAAATVIVPRPDSFNGWTADEAWESARSSTRACIRALKETSE